MSEIVNLRQARKRAARAADDAQAAANRAKHGQSKAERVAKTAEAERIRRALDGARREEP